MFITVVFTLVVLLTQSLKMLEMIASSAAPARIFFQMFMLTLPKLFETVLPISIAITTIFTYNRMIMDNEIVVMRACGFDQNQLAKPVLIVGISATFLLMFFSMWLTPATVNEVKEIKFDVRTKYSSLMLREGVFNTFGDDLTVYIREKSVVGDMEGLMIHDRRDKDNPPVTITAKRGQLLMENDQPMIVVYDGMRQQIDKASGNLTKLYFSKYSLEVKGLGGTAERRWRKEDERSFFELLNPDMNDPRDVENKNLFIIEANRRIAAPWNAFAFAVIAVVSMLYGSFNRKGHTNKIIAGSILIVLFQALSLVLLSFAKKHIWAISLMYLNIIIPVVLGLYVLTPQGEHVLHSIIHRKKIEKYNEADDDTAMEETKC